MKHGTNGDANWTLAEWQSPAPPDGLKREMEHRVAFTARREDRDCITFARLGIAVKAIAAATGLTVNQVQYRLNKEKVKVTQYRHGQGFYARMVFQYVGRRATEQVHADLRRELNG